MVKIIKLTEGNLEQIMEVEKQAFIPSIQTNEKIINRRLQRDHIYLGATIKDNLVGTLAIRFAQFIPDFNDFCERYPTFDEYAELPNEVNANAGFIYSIGIVPQYRNGINAKKLLQGAFDLVIQKKLGSLVGDGRVPSYNGSNNLPYEKHNKNENIHKMIDNYFVTKIFPPMDVLMNDPVTGFYLRNFPKTKILGITDPNFWKGDEPCGGHMIILYQDLRNK